MEAGEFWLPREQQWDFQGQFQPEGCSSPPPPHWSPRAPEYWNCSKLSGFGRALAPEPGSTVTLWPWLVTPSGLGAVKCASWTYPGGVGGCVHSGLCSVAKCHAGTSAHLLWSPSCLSCLWYGAGWPELWAFLSQSEGDCSHVFTYTFPSVDRSFTSSERLLGGGHLLQARFYGVALGRWRYPEPGAVLCGGGASLSQPSMVAALSSALLVSSHEILIPAW